MLTASGGTGARNIMSESCCECCTKTYLNLYNCSQTFHIPWISILLWLLSDQARQSKFYAIERELHEYTDANGSMHPLTWSLIVLIMATLTVHHDGDRGLDGRGEVIVVCEASHGLIVVHPENSSLVTFAHISPSSLSTAPYSPSQSAEF